MKKNLLLVSCLALLAACGGNSGSEYDKHYNRDGQQDAAATETVNTARQSEAEAGTESAASTSGAVEASYEQGKKLIASSDCLACHQEQQKILGPAYVDVAKKYEMNDKNVSYLADKIIKGGSGVWGQVPMSPHPDLKEEEAKEMARYVLSLRN